MSAQGWAAVVLVVLAVVVTGAALVVAVRRLVAERERPVVLAAMTLGARRRAMRQIRKGQPVTPPEVAGVRAVAAEAAGQSHLAVMFAGLAALFIAQALLPFFPTALRVIDAVAAAAQVFAALAFTHTVRGARRFLAAHPDGDTAVGVGR